MWSVPLGPDKKAVPDGEWEKTDITYWDVYCKRIRKDNIEGNYHVYLRTHGEPDIFLGEVLHSTSVFKNWWAFSSRPEVQSMIGFASRRFAIGYLLFQTGHINDVNY